MFLFAQAKDVMQRRTKEAKNAIICHRQRKGRIANWIQPKISATTVLRDLLTILLLAEAKNVIICRRKQIFPVKDLFAILRIDLLMKFLLAVAKNVIIRHHRRRRIANWIQPKISATTQFRDLSTVLLLVVAKNIS